MKKSLPFALGMALLMSFSVALAAFWRPTQFIADFRPKVDLVEMVPERFGDWQVDPSIVPLQPSPDLQKVISATYDQVLARTYRNAQGQRVMLSMAYGRNQHEGMNTHRPEICYPAQGLQIDTASQRGLLPAAGVNIPVTRVVAHKGDRNEPITYWLIVGDRVTHFGSEHKWLTLEYGLKRQIPDGILVRVSTIDRNNAQAFEVQRQFVVDMLAGMSPAHRKQLLGDELLPN